MDENGQITNDKRIRASLPTIEYLIGKGARVILCSHLGRPKGQVKKEFSLAPVAKALSELLGKKVALSQDLTGEDAKKKAGELKDGDVMLLENIRFDAREEKNDPQFAKELASLADVYVNDAFGTAHRAHASTAGVASYLPAACGFLIKKEIEVMGRALEEPKRPLVVILGGSKVSDKIGVINHLLDKSDKILIGGGMAYTFLKAQGHAIGNSLCEDDKVEYAREMMRKAEEKKVSLLLPADSVAADAFDKDSPYTVTDDADIPDGKMGLDIGPKTVELFKKAIKGAGTIIWNGPMGVFEFDAFAKGTFAVAEAIAAEKDAVSIIGGGDSVAAVKKLGFADRMTHISTGGGASLEFLEGKELPGIACLEDR